MLLVLQWGMVHVKCVKSNQSQHLSELFQKAGDIFEIYVDVNHIAEFLRVAQSVQSMREMTGNDPKQWL